MVFSALAFAQCEILWYFQHVGIASTKSKAVRMVSVEIDPSDPTIGFLSDGMDHLCCLVHKYIAAIRGYALSYLSSCGGRIRFLLNTPGMALDLDASLKGLFQQIVQHLENIPKPQGIPKGLVNNIDDSHIIPVIYKHKTFGESYSLQGKKACYQREMLHTIGPGIPGESYSLQGKKACYQREMLHTIGPDVSTNWNLNYQSM